MHDRNEPYKKATSAVKVRRILPLALLVLGLLWLTACGDIAGTGTVKSVTIEQDGVALVVGSTVKLTATVAVDGQVAKTVAWKSSDATVATVANDGTVTAKAVGAATITATSTADPTKSDSVSVSVTAQAPADAVVSVSVDPPTLQLEVGASALLQAQVATTGNAAAAVTWQSSNPAVATVNDAGEVTGVAEGSATITATSTFDTTKAGTATVTVMADAPVVVPPEATFTADPAQISTGDSATLAWEVTGDYDSIRITQSGNIVTAGLPAAGSTSVSPTSSTTYQLEVFYDDGLQVTRTARVGVSPPVGAPVINSFNAQVMRGSQILFDWEATGALSWELFATGGGTEVSLGAGLGNGQELTAPIPSSTTQHYRLDVTNGLVTTSEDISGPTTIVISSDDYDRYDAADGTQEEAIPGTLRAIVQTALPGSIIGFASDITSIDLKGVDLYRGVSPIADAHLVIAKNLVISGPSASPVVLKGVSAQPAGDTSQPLTWHSRMVYVAPGVTAELENLELSGGDFIYTGAGISNLGTLTIDNVAVTGNRAFGDGGGISNGATGTLTIIDSVISDNGAYTLDAEVGVDWYIRGNPLPSNFGNAPGGYGGGISNKAGGVITVRNSNIVDNEARFSGGGIYNEGDLAASEDTQVNGNSANFTAYDQTPGEVSYGGGIMNGERGTLSMNSGTINGNVSAEQGGGLWMAAGATTALTSVNIGDNEVGLAGVNGYGGGIMHNFYTDEEDNLTLTGVSYLPVNTANRGGATVDSNLESQVRGPRPAGLAAPTLNPLEYRLSPLPPR